MPRKPIKSLLREWGVFASPSKAIKGHVDGYAAGRVKGWALNPQQPSEPVDLDLLIDGATVLRITADRFRRDLKRANLSAGWNGFSVGLPKSIMDGRSHELAVVTAKGRQHLGGSPLPVFLPFIEPWSVIRFDTGEIGLAATDGPVVRGIVRFDDGTRGSGIELRLAGPGGWTATTRSDSESGAFSVQLPDDLATSFEPFVLEIMEKRRGKPAWIVSVNWTLHPFDYGCSGFNNNELEGWLRNLERPNEVCTFDLLIDGHAVSTECCDRRTLIDTQTGWCGFSAPVSDLWADGRVHRLQMRIHGSDLVVPNNPWLLNLGEGANYPKGFVEWLPSGDLSGWAYSVVSPDSEHRVSLLADDQTIASTLTTFRHPDLDASGIHMSGGFKLPVADGGKPSAEMKLVIESVDGPPGRNLELSLPQRWPEGIPFVSSAEILSGIAVLLTPSIGFPSDIIETDWSMLAIAMHCLSKDKSVTVILPDQSTKRDIIAEFLRIWRELGEPGHLRFAAIPEMAVSSSLAGGPLIAQRMDHWARRQKFTQYIAPSMGGILSHAIEAHWQGIAYQGVEFELIVTLISGTSRLTNHQFPESFVELLNDNLELEGMARVGRLRFANKIVFEQGKANGLDRPEVSSIRRVPWASLFPGEAEAEDDGDAGFPVIAYCAPLSANHGLTAICDMLDILQQRSGHLLEGCRVVFAGPAGSVFRSSSVDFLNARAARWRFELQVIETSSLDEAIAKLAELKGRKLWVSSDDDIGGRVDFWRQRFGWPGFAIRDGHDQRVPVGNPGIASNPRVAAEKLVQWLEGGDVDLLTDDDPVWSLETAAPSTDESENPSAPNIARLQNADHPSLCITHFNRIATLWQLLNSIEIQLPKVGEIIVVDDGSPYQSVQEELDKVEYWLAQRGGSLIRSYNGYPGAARNEAVRQSSRDWMIFMDDDNLAMPDMVQSFCDAQSVCGADVLTAVYYGFDANRLIDVSRSIPEVIMCPQGPDKGTGVLSNVFGDANLMISRQAFEAAGGFTEVYGRGHEDWEFLARLSLQGFTIERILKPLFWYRLNPGGMSALRPDPSMNIARGLSAYRDHLDPSIYRLLELTNGWYWG